MTPPIQTVQQFLEAAKTQHFTVVVDSDSVTAYAPHPDPAGGAVQVFDFGDNGPERVLMAVFLALGIKAENP